MENKKFYQTERGKIFSKLIHDTNAGIGAIKYYSSSIRNLSIDGNLEKEYVTTVTNTIEALIKSHIQDVIDEAYEKIKTLEGY